MKKELFFYINEPVVTMRETPSHESKVVSQALFAEKISLINTESKWACIETPDGYLGWIPKNSYVERQEVYTPSMSISRLSAHIYLKKEIEYGPLFTLPFGAPLAIVEDKDPRWLTTQLPCKRLAYVQKGDLSAFSLKKKDLVSFSTQFLGLPYTWGGRSSFGFDCSGFIQMLFYHIGHQFKRDARQQIHDPALEPIDPNSYQSGDLVFFGKSKEQIGHVGLLLDEQTFIHATSKEQRPWIRISSLRDKEWTGNETCSYPYRTFMRFKGIL